MKTTPSLVSNCMVYSALFIVTLSVFEWSRTGVLAEWKKIENPCLCQEFRCNGGEFCLDKTKVCNGVPDCIGGEDERGHNGTGKCVRKRAKCSVDEFKCKFGDCIKFHKVCDGRIDCWGAVDEAIDFCTWVHGNDTDTEGHHSQSDTGNAKTR